MIALLSFASSTELALRCPRCSGSAREHPCPYCEGTGRDPYPRLYAYRVPDDVEVGEILVVPPSRYYRAEKDAVVVALGDGGHVGPVAIARRR